MSDANEVIDRCPRSRLRRMIDAVRRHLPLMLICVMAAALHTHGVTDRSLWLDEGFSLWDASHPYKSWGPKVRPFYYLLLQVWLSFDSHPGWLRSLSYVPAVGAVALTYLIGRRLVGVRAALVAAVLMTLSPKLVQLSQEVRMYSLGNFLVLAATLSLLRSLAAPAPSSLWAWAVLRLLGLLTIPLSAPILAADAIALFLARRHDRPFLGRAAGWLAIIAALWSPFAWRLLRSSEIFLSGWVRTVPQPLPPRFASMPLKTFTVGTSPLLASMNQWPHLLAVLLFGCLCIWGVHVAVKQRQQGMTWLVAWALLPAVTLAAVSFGKGSIWIDRYLVFTAPFVFLILAAGFITLWDRMPRAALATAVFYLSATASGLHHYFTEPPAEDWRGVAAAINDDLRTGDAVFIVGSARDSTSLTYYLHPGATIHYANLVTDHLPVRVPRHLRPRLSPRSETTLKMVPPPKIGGPPSGLDEVWLNHLVQNLPPTVTRVWVVLRTSAGDDVIRPLLAEAMSMRFAHAETLRTGRLQLARLRAEVGPPKPQPVQVQRVGEASSETSERRL